MDVIYVATHSTGLVSAGDNRQIPSICRVFPSLSFSACLITLPVQNLRDKGRDELRGELVFASGSERQTALKEEASRESWMKSHRPCYLPASESEVAWTFTDSGLGHAPEPR